ncbi:MAG TPA: LuxR C-terminal-related transcriptional regulator [Allosphingosinicella sp.]
MSHQRTVYLIDGQVESRRSMTRTLAAIGAEAWPFGSGAEFLEIFGHLMPACILVDMDIEQPSGLDVLRLVAARQLPWPVIALSAKPNVEVAVEAMKLGARDYLARPVRPAALAAALNAAWPALEQSVRAAEVRAAAQEKVARLTPRELDIAVALLGGQGNKGVAHDLGISVRTVEMHRAHVMTKLGVKSLAEAAVIATQAGLLGAPRPTGATPPRLALPPVRALPLRATASNDRLLAQRA